MVGDPAGSRLRRHVLWGVIAVLFAAHAVLGTLATTAMAPTFDETIHLTAGFVYLRTGDYRLNSLFQPPAAEMWAALPLLVLKPDIPNGLPPYDDIERLQFSYADRFFYRNNVDPELLLVSGRIMILVLSLLLGLLLFIWSRALFGSGAGLACLVLWAFFPSFLAHGSLVTTDLALTLGFTASLFMSWRWRRAHAEGRSGWRETVAVGLCLGLTLGVKYSGVMILPVLGLLFSVGLLGRAFRIRRALAQVAVAGGVALALLLAVYQFRPLALWYWPGFMNVVTGLTEGRPAFFLGHHSEEGWLHYFPVLFLLKTPLPLLLLLIPVSFNRRALTKDTGLFILLPAILYFSVACLAKINIGHRHILPVYPLLMIWISGLARRPTSRRQAVRLLPWVSAGILAVWYVAGTVRAHPWHLSYFNELIGSPDRAYLYASDSNVDWGQGLKALGDHLRREGIDGVYLSYFGSADPAYYGIRYLPVAWFDGLTPEYFAEARPGDPAIAARNRTVLAVSATNLQGTYFAVKDFFSFLLPIAPDAVVARSILVYDLDRHPRERGYFQWLLNGPSPR